LPFCVFVRIWQRHQSRHDAQKRDGQTGQIPLKERENVMKALRASILVLALSVCAYAGDMPTCLTGNMPAGVAGNMANDVAGNMENDAADPITEIALNLVQSVLSLF
jgi:hypothetical protein